MSPTVKVFRKEMREMLRDKRIRSTAIFGPIILIVGLMTLFSMVFGSLGKKQSVRVTVVQNTSPIVSYLRRQGFTIDETPDLDTGKRLILEGKARVVLTIANLADGRSQVEAWYDHKEQRGQIDYGQISGALHKLSEGRLKDLLQSHGVSPESAVPVVVKDNNVQIGSTGGGSDLIVSMLPYLIVIWAFYGGMSVASDIAAGEKERNTLETLLITPVSRTQIVMGKFLALALVCLASSLSSLVGLGLFMMIKPPGSAEMLKGGLGLSLGSFLITLLLLLPLVAFFASVLVAISTYARNSREAQTYLGLFSFVILMPAMFSQFIGLTDYASARWINLVPILGTATNIRAALMGKSDLISIGLTVGVSVVLALLAVRLAVWLFNREEVLVRV